MTRQTDRKRGGTVKVSTLAINVIPEPVDVPIPTGFVGAKRGTGDTLPLLQLRMSKDELSVNEGIVFNPAGDVITGVASWADLAGVVTVGVAPLPDLAGDVTVVVASSADHAEDVPVGVASLANLAGVVTIGVAPSPDLAGDVTVGLASSADLAGVHTISVASSADLAGVDPESDFPAGLSFMNECVTMWCRFVPTDLDESFVELEAIVIGAVGTGPLVPDCVGRGDRRGVHD